MLQPSNRGTPPQPKILYPEYDSWELGVFSRLDADRTPVKGLRNSDNGFLDQNGVLQPRPGLKLYGAQPSGTVLGQVFEFVALNTGVTPNVPESWLMCMQVISGVGRVTVNKDGGAWTTVSGKTYSATAKAHFEQIGGKVVITNGVDTLSYYDITSQTITGFNALSAPTSGPTVTPATVSGFNGTNVPLFYKVTYSSSVGETAASAAGTATVNKLREQWNGTTENVVLTGSGVPASATRVNIYFGTDTNSLYFLDSVTMTGGTSFTYTDYGAIATNSNRIAPVGDSTSGPKAARCTNIKGQLYMCGDSDNLYRIWFGGVGSSVLDFSAYNGGGWVEPNKGGKDIPVVVKPFRDGKGTPMGAAFSKGTNGAGKRYLLSPATTTLGSTTISYMSVQEDNGQDGTDSPDGVIMLNDGAYYPSRSGFKVSNTKQNIQNIISTNGVSDGIAPDVLALSAKYMDACVGLAYDQRIYWAVPYEATANNQVWILDLRSGGAWIRPWYIAADWMTLYADNSDGLTKFLVLSGNKLYQLDYTSATNDNGVAFSTNFVSGNIPCGPAGESANIRYLQFVFLRPQGNITVSATLHTEDGPVTFSKVFNNTSNQTVSGWGRYGWGVEGWGNLTPLGDTLPIKSLPAREPFTLEIDEECDYYSWQVSTTQAGVSFQLAKVIESKVMVGYKDPIS